MRQREAAPRQQRVDAKPPPAARAATREADALARSAGRGSTADLLRLQRTVGNQVVQRMCAACADDEKKKRGAAGAGTIQAKPVPGQAGAAPRLPEDLSAQIGALRGGGDSLPAALRADFEPRFGVDLGGVRVHHDDRAAGTARSLQARAFTLGQDIAFGAGEYAPSTPAGRRLLAHEVAHVIQQSGAGAAAAGDLRLGSATDPSEAAADRAAEAVVSGAPAPVGPGVAPAVQRDPLPGAGGLTTIPGIGPLPGLGALPGPDSLLDHASPTLAAAVGSANLNGFVTNQAILTPGHLGVIQSTAHNIVVLLRQYPMSTIEVIGHTDTVGTEANNLTLGTARAEAVRAELVRQGVPAAIITTSSVGEGPPQAVRTGDNVPNAQNRRAEIRFRPRASLLPTTVGTLRPPDQAPPQRPGFTFPRPDFTFHPGPDFFTRPNPSILGSPQATPSPQGSTTTVPRPQGWQTVVGAGAQVAWHVSLATGRPANPAQDVTLQVQVARNYADHPANGSGTEVQGLIQVGYNITTGQVTVQPGAQLTEVLALFNGLLQIAGFVQVLAGVAAGGGSVSGQVQPSIGAQMVFSIGPVQFGVQAFSGVTLGIGGPSTDDKGVTGVFQVAW